MHVRLAPSHLSTRTSGPSIVARLMRDRSAQRVQLAHMQASPWLRNLGFTGGGGAAAPLFIECKFFPRARARVFLFLSPRGGAGGEAALRPTSALCSPVIALFVCVTSPACSRNLRILLRAAAFRAFSRPRISHC